MYNNYVLFVIGFFIFTILIQCLDRYVGNISTQESFKRRKKKRRKKGRFGKKMKKFGKGIKKFAQSPAGIATFSILAGAACGVATAGIGAAACAAAVAGGIGGSIQADNKRRKRRHRRDRIEEHRRRCRVLTGRENPKYNGKYPFNGYESVQDPCGKFRKKDCAINKNAKCNALETQCRLARSCTYFDSNQIEEGNIDKIDRSRV